MKFTRKRWSRWLIGGVLAAVLLSGGYYLARHHAWPAAKVWRIERMNRSAQAFLDAGDPANALLTARKSLQSSAVRNAPAWRIAAAASVARQRPDALWYQENLVREEPTRANRLELIRLALHFESPAYALPTITAMAAGSGDDAEFHRYAAQVFARTGQPLLAQPHLLALVRLQPGDRTAQLDLAEIELAADPDRKDAALRARVRALAAESGLRVRALTLLLRENVAGRVKAGTEDLVRQLQLTAEPDVPGRLLVIEALFLLERPAAAQLLAQLQAEVPERPIEVARVLEFLTRTGRAEPARLWAAGLPAATRQDEDVQRMVAEAMLVQGDAAGLEAYLRGARWPKRDYLRAALLAHAYRDLGRSAEFAEAWKLALVSAGGDLRKTTALLARADGWRWVTERHDVVWKLFALVPTNESVQQILVLWERHQGNTVNLNRLFTRIVEIQPQDEVARNNLAYTSLLLDANVARATRMAAELAAAQPKNPFFATTYALALYKQGKMVEALARLNALAPRERIEPVRRLLRALCFAALGQAEPAADMMNSVVLQDMLPEEKALAAAGRTEIARLERGQGNRTRLEALRAGAEQNAGRTGWLALVAAETRRTATTDMQLADSLYATSDWPGLQELLRTTDWHAGDYLRSALQARVAREQDDVRQSQEAWRQALALAGRDPGRLQDLRALVTQWKWAPERLETLNRIFERTPTDRANLAELLLHYRTARRTSDLVRVLGLHVADATEPTDEAVAQAYYSLLLDTNLARAHVVARNAFEAAPGDLARRMIYVFSLSKQRRAAEARPLLAEVKAGAVSDLVPVSLLRAAVLIQFGDTAAVRADLAQFNPAIALPEEVALATRLEGQLTAPAVAAGP